jgi:S-formylglutathione hydrolase FrmB
MKVKKLLVIAFLLPAVGRSYYTDTTFGHKYWTFISEELPALARAFFPLSQDRADNFVAGLSMGGYGAFKLALRQPKRFAAAASLSGALDAARFARAGGEDRKEFEGIFGNLKAVPGSDNDLLHLASRLARSRGPKPRLYQCCGTEDFLYPDNLVFRDHTRRVGLDLTYEEGPGTHEWRYWDRMIQRVLEWLPARKIAPKAAGPALAARPMQGVVRETAVGAPAAAKAFDLAPTSDIITVS